MVVGLFTKKYDTFSIETILSEEILILKEGIWEIETSLLSND